MKRGLWRKPPSLPCLPTVRAGPGRVVKPQPGGKPAAAAKSIVLARPDPAAYPQHLSLDKGYDNPSGRGAAEQAGYIPHIRRIGEEKLDERGQKRHPARRWVVERTLAWLSKCRAILVRYDKKPLNYLGLVQLACALLRYRRLHRIQEARAN